MPLLTLHELEQTFPAFKGKVGHAFARFVMKVLAIDSINDLYDRYSSLQEPEFTEALLKDVGVSYEVKGVERIGLLGDKPFITISNHPYGGIDGIVLIDLFGHYRNDYKVIVNKFLARIEAMDMNFITVTPTGKVRSTPTRDSILGIKMAIEHARSGAPLGIFPSGAVSDLSLKDRCIRDRKWQKPIIRMIKELRLPILPVKFLDGNSLVYYLLGLIDWRVRLLKLPSELLNKRGKRVRLVIGDVITAEEQDRFPDLDEFGNFLRHNVYQLKWKQ